MLLPRAFEISSEFSRPVTEGERWLARRVYGAQIELSKIKIHKARLPKKFMGEFEACVSGNNIYFVPEKYRDDISTQDLDERAGFVHELEHVNQSQHGLDLEQEFARLMALTQGDYDKAYELPPDMRDFKDYNAEQQAVIVAAVYELSEMLKGDTLTPTQRQKFSQDFSFFAALLPPQFDAFKRNANLGFTRVFDPVPAVGQG